MMKTLSLLALAATAKLVSAHATVQAVWINDADQGTGTAIRSPPNNSPLVDVTSSDMTCNVNNKAVGTTLKVKAGDKFTFEWHHESRSASDQIIDPSHNGPVLVYIAPTTTGTAGNGWVKLAEDGFSNGQWAVERLRAAAGKHSITIPDIAAGTYLLRAEIIALHEGYRVNGAQFYMECVQIEVTSSSGSTTKTLPAGVAIPGAYSAQDPGILFDLYNSFSSYKVPGPAVWDGASLSSGGSGSSPAPSSSSSSKPVATTTTTPTAPPTAVPTTLQTSVRPATTKQPVPTSSLPPPPSSSTPTGSVAEWQQCGGINFSGSGTCASGLTCKQWNPYYFQCIKA